MRVVAAKARRDGIYMLSGPSNFWHFFYFIYFPPSLASGAGGGGGGPAGQGMANRFLKDIREGGTNSSEGPMDDKKRRWGVW